MKERRLLERISAWEDGGQRTNQTQVDVLLKSVTDHLRRLLNTRQGSVQLDPLFGVPDFTNIAGGLNAGSTADIEADIKRMVLRYEPRIKAPKVTLRQDASDLLSIEFVLEGSIDVDDREIPLLLATTVGANGKVRIT